MAEEKLAVDNTDRWLLTLAVKVLENMLIGDGLDFLSDRMRVHLSLVRSKRLRGPRRWCG